MLEFVFFLAELLEGDILPDNLQRRIRRSLQTKQTEDYLWIDGIVKYEIEDRIGKIPYILRRVYCVLSHKQVLTGKFRNSLIKLMSMDKFIVVRLRVSLPEAASVGVIY